MTAPLKLDKTIRIELDFLHIFNLRIRDVKRYWEELEEKDTLKYRLSSCPDPHWDDVIKLMRQHKNHMYMAVEDGIVKGEFMLEAFTGKAAQIHFSMQPGLPYKDTLRICRSACDAVLGQWKDTNGDRFLHSLYANIAVSNRASCLTALKSGFKKLGMLPSGMYIARHNRHEDGTLLVRTL